VIAQHLQTVPAPPSQRGAPAVPPQLEHLVLACLAKKPEDRPQSATALSSQLASIDLEPWTDAQAQAWWAAAGTRPERVAVASGETVTREV
jgi:serine/threonine-protein kinase